MEADKEMEFMEAEGEIRVGIQAIELHSIML